MSSEIECSDRKRKERILNKHARRMAFSKYVSALETISTPKTWNCCSKVYENAQLLQQHVSKIHMNEVLKIQNQLILEGSPDARWSALRNGKKEKECNANEFIFPKQFTENEVFPWLPAREEVLNEDNGTILLFYKYRLIEDTEHVASWQKELCERLYLTGKVRVAKEGLNVTVGGNTENINQYIGSVMKHPLFNTMSLEDFKTSAGSSKDFSCGLKVGIHQECVPMGVPTEAASPEDGGIHITPSEFHKAVEEHINKGDISESIFIDCRNFYESKVGTFKGSIQPDIRKFSYWPEYVDENKEIFQDKNVYMYCTGGIRCERGSAYLKNKGVCANIYQLDGGIHRYIEQYPDGYFRGKLFVFDDRYTIPANDDVLSNCKYCSKPWDQYQLCSSMKCYQLVLSCDACQGKQLTACCHLCQDNNNKGLTREQCECTQTRERIPHEKNTVSQ